MIQRYHNEPVGLRVTPEPGDYLKLHDRILPDGSEQITVGRGGSWSVLACKEVYGKASKAVQASGAKSAVFDLSAAAELGRDGLLAAAEGICGGAYQMKYTLSDQWEPEFACYASGEGWQEQDLQLGWTLAESILRTRSLVNRPANLLTPERLATALTEQCAGLPVETQCYDRGTLHELGLEAFLAVGDSSGHPPVLAVLRYTGAPDSAERLGLVGKGVTVDSGGYNLKSSGSMAGIKGDMAGGAAVAAAVRAIAAAGIPVNVTAVVPCCENRISTTSLLPGDLIGSLSGKTIEVFNADAEGRLILADGLTWAIRKEGCTRLVDAATLTGAICAMLGYVATGVMASDDGWYAALERAAAHSGERFWRMPDFPEYEKLIRGDLGDVRNTSRDGCGAITAGLFLRHFTEGLPWLHLDIAGTADNKGYVWEHQVPGADRLELCAHLVIGGTTPTHALFRQVQRDSGVPINVLIRPRFGDFLYTEPELEEMCEEIAAFRDLGANGVVIGALTPDGELDLAQMRRMMACAGQMEVTLHRAFDMTRDPFRALEDAVSLGCRTILSSGQAANAALGAPLLAKLNGQAAGRIDLMAGCGVKRTNIAGIAAQTGITTFHTTGRKGSVDSGMRYRKEGVSMGLPSLSEYELWLTDEAEFRACAETVHALGTPGAQA